MGSAYHYIVFYLAVGIKHCINNHAGDIEFFFMGIYNILHNLINTVHDVLPKDLYNNLNNRAEFLYNSMATNHFLLDSFASFFTISNAQVTYSMFLLFKQFYKTQNILILIMIQAYATVGAAATLGINTSLSFIAEFKKYHIFFINVVI